MPFGIWDLNFAFCSDFIKNIPTELISKNYHQNLYYTDVVIEVLSIFLVLSIEKSDLLTSDIR